jgi:hypothetical protein
MRDDGLNLHIVGKGEALMNCRFTVEEDRNFKS